MTERSQLDQDVTWMMAFPQGRRVMYHILGELGLYRQPFVPGNPELTAFNCGSLNGGLALFSLVTSAAPDAYAVMLREHEGENDAQ